MVTAPLCTGTWERRPSDAHTERPSVPTLCAGRCKAAPDRAVWHTGRGVVCSPALPCAFCSFTQSLIHLVTQTLTHSLTYNQPPPPRRPPNHPVHKHRRSCTWPTCQLSQGLMESRSCFHSFSCRSIGYRDTRQCTSERAILLLNK